MNKRSILLPSFTFGDIKKEIKEPEKRVKWKKGGEKKKKKYDIIPPPSDYSDHFCVGASV